jgi:uncharacterized protein (TIGR02996 family)
VTTLELERASFVKAIVECPADNTPRLVFADWLEEQGEADRAEYIRLAIRMDDLLNLQEEAPNKVNVNIYELRKRLRLLLKKNFLSWGLDIPGPWTPHGFKCEDEIFLSTGGNETLARVQLTRGFVSKIELPCDEFVRRGFAEELFSSHPIERVQIAKMLGPASTGAHFVLWSPFNLAPNELRKAIYRAVPGDYNTAEEAYAAASRPLVAWGRQQANLPPL